MPQIQELKLKTQNSKLKIRLAGTLLFVGLLVWLDLTGALPLEEVLGTLAGANPALVALSIGLYVPFLAVKAARWRMLCGDMGLSIGWADAWRIYAIGLAAGTFTPGQAGDVLKAWYLERMGYGLGRALGSSVLDRLFDVAGLALLGLLGVAVYGQRFAGQTPALVILALACLGAVAVFAWRPARAWAVNLVSGMVSLRLSRLENEEQHPTLRQAQGRLSNPSTGSGQALQPPTPNPQPPTPNLQPSTLARAGLLTVGSFAISIFRVWLLAAALGVLMGPLEASGYVGLTTAAALVPVSIGGVGTRDTVSVLALNQLGRQAAEAVALSSLILLLNIAQAIIGWVVWLRYKRVEG